MKVFISWSEEPSLRFATFLRDWLPCVIQATEPFLSSEDVRKGSRWFSEISERLDGTDFGILCVTPENRIKPWLLFEAGALAKKVKHAHVCPLVLGMSKAQLESPLNQFQAADTTKDDVYQLMKSINSALEHPLVEARLKAAFEKFWGEFDEQVNTTVAQLRDAKHEGAAPPAKRTVPDMVEEILDLTRGLARHLDKSATGVGLDEVQVRNFFSPNLFSDPNENDLMKLARIGAAESIRLHQLKLAKDRQAALAAARAAKAGTAKAESAEQRQEKPEPAKE